MRAKFQQLKNNLGIKLSDKQILTWSGVFVAGVAAYTAYRYFVADRTKKAVQVTVEDHKSFQQVYRQVIMSVKQSIDKNQELNSELIKCILRNQYKLAELQYKTFILKVRNQRRKVIKNKNQYRKLILSMDSESEQLIDRNLNAILAHFCIEKTNWIEAIEMWSTDTEENKDEFEDLLSELDNQLIDALRNKSKAPLSYKKLKEIYEFKIYSLCHLDQSGLDFEISQPSDDEPDLNAKYTLIEKYILDLVFSKFGVEQEDIIFSQNQLSQADQDKLYTIQDEYTEMIRNMIYGDEPNEVLEEQKASRNNDQDDSNNVDDGDDGQNEEQVNLDIKNQERKDAADEQDEQEDEGQYF